MSPRPSRARRDPRRLPRELLATLLLAGPATAAAQQAPAQQTAVVRVGVVVTAVSGSSVYLDKGTDAQIEPGDALELRPPGRPPLLGVVRAVSRNSARAELAPGATGVSIGDPGEVLVPSARFETESETEEEADEPERETPPHPPWTNPEQGWDPTQPLLAPAFGRPPEELPTTIHGRLFTQFYASRDWMYGNDYRFWRTGVDVTVENPFGDGGEFYAQGEAFQRLALPDDGDDERTTRGQLERAAYLWGGTREQANRVQVGRFLQSAFPELGLLDGVEMSHRTDSGSSVGASFGYMPEPFHDLQTGNDLQAAVFWRSAEVLDRPVVVGAAFQSTWHEGEQDRNLLVTTLDARPSEDITLAFDALVDFYDSNDEVKDNGAELTQAYAQGRWRLSPEFGVGVHASHMRWPETLRPEFGEIAPEQIADNEVTRVGLDGWHQLTEHTRLDGRVDEWQDQDDSGHSGSVRVGWRDLFWEHGELAVDMFETSAAYTDGYGLRVSASRAFETLGYGTLSWEISEYSSDTLGETTDLRQQALRASLDSTLPWDWLMSTYAERRFGDSQDSVIIGLSLQQRF